MSNIKYSKLRYFKIVTGKHFLDLTQKITEAKGDDRLEAMETITLGLHLLDTLSVKDAKEEFNRLQKKEFLEEKYEILDTVDGLSLAADLMK